MLAPEAENRLPDRDPAVERLRNLLAYVEQVIKLDERPALALGEHRLANGQSFVLHQHEAQGLPGLRHDGVDDDGPVWLALERLKRHEAPPPPAAVAPWLALSPDPDKPPKIREARVVTVPAAEKDALVARGEARAEDCAPALKPEEAEAGRFDVRLRLEDRPRLREALDAYLAEVWLPWAEAERPRRRSVALYQKLFQIAQAAEIGAADQAIELVWGMGLTRWRRDGREIDLPLIERLVEIEIDEEAGAAIRIRPRETPALVNLRPYEELQVGGAGLAFDSARRALAAVDPDEGVSPFRRESTEPTLRACQTLLDPDGRYLPDHGPLPLNEPPPAAEHLTVTDRWVLFARRRSDNFILADIRALAQAVEVVETDLPGPARTLVMGPSDGPVAGGWTPLGGILGETAAAPDAPGPDASPLGDLFFPKPFNDEQIEIVRRLEASDGVVVQGPPGTGKTHTISNIICHMMATGRRVLVVSHGEPALAVLRDQLPAGVRDLAISITATEREGYRQLEAGLRLLQSTLSDLKPGEQRRLIRDLEGAIVAQRDRLARIDREIEGHALAQLSPLPGRDERPADLARRIAAARGRHAWFTDRPERFTAEAGLSATTIDALRAARMALGTRLEHLDAALPSPADLPDGEELCRLHEDLVRAIELQADAERDEAFPVRIRTQEELALADSAVEALQTLQRLRSLAGQHPWLQPAAAAALAGTNGDGLGQALRGFVADAHRVLEERGRFLARPVETPLDFVPSDETIGILDALARGENPFGLLSFAARARRATIEAFRLAGLSPQGPSDWAHIRDAVVWGERLQNLDLRWGALAAELGAPAVLIETARDLEHVLAPIETVAVSAPEAFRALDAALRRLGRGPETARSLWENPSRLAAAAEAFANAAAASRLLVAEAEIERLKGLFPPESGRFGQLARNLLQEAVGRPEVEGDKVGRLWTTLRERISDLVRNRERFALVRLGAQEVAAAGAPEWAKRLRSEPATDSGDTLAPADWSDAWDWAASCRQLTRLDGRERLTALAEERVRLDADIREGFGRLVRERTFYALAGAMTGPVRSALMMFATALRRTGKGTGKGALRHRLDARAAMAHCYDAIPCWIMPSWRVAEQLPADLSSFDLVIMDEASQSDIREIATLLRGKKILVVGDDKQVSPTAAFIEGAKIDRLEHGFLRGQPFKTLLLPGASLYDLAKVMFPDKLVMLKEHFRCVEPIIRFSAPFYPEPLIPLRVPTVQERLDPPLVDIYVEDGRREGDKLNPREAEVIVEEIRRFVEDPSLARVPGDGRPRTIGVISLIGAKQAALINKRLLDALGEETMLRHHIACGDSATFQGNERDVVFLSMVADPRIKQAQTAIHFEQRFNVALSRARDRIVLVRSVREEELNPSDLKARVIRHFAEPMPEAASGQLEAACESDFERDVLRRLVASGYRVTPQVGAQGYRIDLVVEGVDGRRLAVECDGDRYHGPERWADDMRRQRVLERVGWRFWRCWASSFTLDPDSCMADLLATLGRIGIEPAGSATEPRRYTEHRTVRAAAASDAARREPPAEARGIALGDRVALRTLDNNKTVTLTLSDGRDDPANGLLPVASPLGAALLGLGEEDEAEFEEDGRLRRVLVVKTKGRALAEA